MKDKCAHAKTATDAVTGETACCSCGQVMSSEVYCDDVVGSNHEAGATKTYGKHTSTTIGKHDHSGNKINGYDSMKAWDLRSRPNRTNKARMVVLLRGACDRLDIPDRVLNLAIDISDKARDHGITKGRLLNVTAAGSLSIACRLEGIPRTLSDITRTMDTRRNLSSATMNKIITALDLTIEPPEASSHIPRIVSNAGVDEVVGRKAHEMFAKFKSKRLDTSRKPSAFAAAVVYIACRDVGKPLTSSIVADAAGVSSVSVRNISRMLDASASAAP